jgi:hypothetical protein
MDGLQSSSWELSLKLARETCLVLVGTCLVLVVGTTIIIYDASSIFVVYGWFVTPWRASVCDLVSAPLTMEVLIQSRKGKDISEEIVYKIVMRIELFPGTYDFLGFCCIGRLKRTRI